MTNSFVTNAVLIERAVSCWHLHRLISQTTQYLDSWLSDLLQSELKMKLLEVEVGARARVPHIWRRHWSGEGLSLHCRKFVSYFVWKWYILTHFMHNACISSMLSLQIEQICLMDPCAPFSYDYGSHCRTVMWVFALNRCSFAVFIGWRRYEYFVQVYVTLWTRPTKTTKLFFVHKATGIRSDF